MFKVLILAAQNTVSDARIEFLIRDRLSWLRFLDFDLGAVTRDENTIRLFREKLTGASAIDALFTACDRQLRELGYLLMGGQIVDATLVAAPKQRSSAANKDAIKAGKSAAEIWTDQPTRAAQKDTGARWTLKFAKARTLPDDRPGVRRQNIWRSSRRKLAECGPRLGVDVKRRACGVASADARWSFA